MCFTTFCTAKKVPVSFQKLVFASHGANMKHTFTAWSFWISSHSCSKNGLSIQIPAAVILFDVDLSVRDYPLPVQTSLASHSMDIVELLQNAGKSTFNLLLIGQITTSKSQLFVAFPVKWDQLPVVMELIWSTLLPAEKDGIRLG